jgi:hypothetical protein
MSNGNPVKVRTAGALRMGMTQIARSLGSGIVTSFTHGPAIEVELAERRCDADIVGLTQDAIRKGLAEKTLIGKPVAVGSIHVGMAIRKGGHRPPIVSLADFKEALQAADSLIYTTAASGDYVHGVIDNMGLADRLASKTERFSSGAEVNDRLLKGVKGFELAFGVATELLFHADKGVVYLGPLPDEIASSTPYEFATLAGHDRPEVAALLAHLASEETREVFAATGVD